MKLMLLIGILALPAIIALMVVIALYHHKNRTAQIARVIGQDAEVKSTLRPEGIVIVNGELWRARSVDGNPIEAAARVSVVGSREHLLLVTPTE